MRRPLAAFVAPRPVEERAAPEPVAAPRDVPPRAPAPAGIASRLRSAFLVAPAPPVRDCSRPAAAVVPAREDGRRGAARPGPNGARPARDRPVAVLAPPLDAFAAGGAAALGRSRGTVLAAVWGGGEPPAVRAPATPGALRLAAKLVARGVTAWATGRLVLAVLDAVDGAPGLAAAAGDAPTVLVVAGPREPAVDAALAGCAAVLVAGAEGSLLTDLAVLEVAALGVPARAVAVPAGARRVLATAGLLAG